MFLPSFQTKTLESMLGSDGAGVEKIKLINYYLNQIIHKNIL